ncbi:uncharacterized protein [Medicago truncatula]|uniref:uncharacterized protein n=1 Tax=Medicago truncatula TaxID=3880 RepID=UPI0019687DCC|nr:uncharacterized protein LOC120580716 [Medicago truncatula]
MPGCNELHPALRDACDNIACKVTRLSKADISRLTEDELSRLMEDELSHLSKDEMNSLIEAEFSHCFALMEGLLSLLFPRKAKDKEITPPEYEHISDCFPVLIFKIFFLSLIGYIALVPITTISSDLYKWWLNKRYLSSIRQERLLSARCDVFYTKNAAQERLNPSKKPIVLSKYSRTSPTLKGFKGIGEISSQEF